jgi:hypothetical protein
VVARLSVFIITRPRATPMAMLRKKKKKVRPASGPSLAGLPSCTTPVASEAKTSGMTTKNSRRRNTRPKGSSSTVETPRISSSPVPEDLMPTCVSQPWRNSGIGHVRPDKEGGDTQDDANDQSAQDAVGQFVGSGAGHKEGWRGA